MQTELLEGYRISPQQEHLWLLQNADHACAYFVKCRVLIEGRLDVEIFRRSLAEVAGRNEILRTTFHVLPSLTVPVQIINEVGPTCRVLDLSDVTSIEQADYVKRIYDEMSGDAEPFFQLLRLSAT